MSSATGRLKAKDENLIKMTTSINKSNPMIDRIVNDESVEGYVMTNDQGTPILTTFTSGAAVKFGANLQQLGLMASSSIKDLDTLDEIIILRMVTKKYEIMVAPHSDFNIMVVQHARHKSKKKKM